MATTFVDLLVTRTQAAQSIQTQRQAMYTLVDQAESLAFGSVLYVASYEDAAAITPALAAADLARLATFFSNCTNNGITLISVQTGATGVATLDAYITANRSKVYSIYVDSSFYLLTQFAALATKYSGDSDMVYFTFETTDYTTSGTGTKWVDNDLKGLKSVWGVDPNPSKPAEYPGIAQFAKRAAYAVSDTTRMTSMRGKLITGITAYDVTKTINTNLTADNVNWCDTTYSGGFAGTMCWPGVFGDGRNYSYWYAIDWAQLNLRTQINNALINSANDPTNPIYYNQNGIDRLQGVIQSVLTQGVNFGLFNETQVTAVAFENVSASDYASGIYSGFAITIRVQGEFKKLTIGVNFTDYAISTGV